MARSPSRIGNLPAETSSFIGRRRELAELRRKLGSARLVTLVGPGGVGKTRLALRRTVDGHVRNILDKLGFDSRTQIAAWVASSEAPHPD